MRKGQAAMEFLMTYGWAILVVLVAIGALAYFGVLSPSQFLPEKCVLSTGSGLFCDDHQADSTADKITLKVRNILTETVTVAIGDASIKIGTATVTNTNALSLTADTAASLEFTRVMAPGDKIKGDILIKFTPGTGLVKVATGQLVTTAAAIT